MFILPIRVKTGSFDIEIARETLGGGVAQIGNGRFGRGGAKGKRRGAKEISAARRLAVKHPVRELCRLRRTHAFAGNGNL